MHKQTLNSMKKGSETECVQGGANQEEAELQAWQKTKCDHYLVLEKLWTRDEHSFPKARTAEGKLKSSRCSPGSASLPLWDDLELHVTMFSLLYK